MTDLKTARRGMSALGLGLALATLPLTGANAEGRKVTIGWAPPDVTGVFATATSYFEAAAKGAAESGLEVEVLTRAPATHTAFADQVAIIEDLISRRVDVIAISPTEVEVIKPALRRANEAGVPIIVVNLLEPIPDVEVASYIGFDNTQGAAVTAYSLLDYFGGPGVLGTGDKVEVAPDQYLDLAFWQNLYGGLSEEQRAAITANGAIIEGVAGGFFSTARMNGFKGVLADYPNVKILGTSCAADWNREKGVKCAEDIMQSNPEGLDFVWAASNEMGMGAAQALEGAGRLETAEMGPVVGDKSVAVFTNDVTPESTDRISEGKIIAETTHGFADWGWFGAEFAARLACGLEVPKTFDIRPRTAYIANAREFYPSPKLPAIDWATIAKDCKPKS